jgi:hypothetical protein
MLMIVTVFRYCVHEHDSMTKTGTILGEEETVLVYAIVLSDNLDK